MNEEMHDKLNDKVKNTKILVYAIVGALIIGLCGLGLSIKTLDYDLRTKDMQISVLTEEVGELREENVLLYDHIDENSEYITTKLDNIHSTINSYVDSEKEEYEVMKTDLLHLVEEQENSLDQLTTKNKQLEEEVEFIQYDDEILNILVLGSNAGLTDTILVANVNPSNESISFFSVPRDLYINGRKINSVYKSFGIEKLKNDIHTVTGIYPDKHVIIDFDSFKDIIDSLGGIDLYVHEDIYDTLYPTSDHGYTVYSIEKGSHHMDGEEALKYARSRKSTSDFDRSKRQQQIIQSVRVKVKMLDLLGNVDTAVDLFNTVTQGIETDIDVFEAFHYLRNYQNYVIESGNVLSTSNHLYSSKSLDGQYILLPKSGSYYQIKQQIAQLIKN